MKVFFSLMVVAAFGASSHVQAQPALIHPSLTDFVLIKAGKGLIPASNSDSANYQDSLAREVPFWKDFRPSNNKRLGGGGEILNAYQTDSSIAIPNAYRGDESIEIPNAASEFRILPLPVK